MQILEPPNTQSYKTEDGHFIKTFLISSKLNQAGWKVSPTTLKEKVQSFIGKPFSIIPEQISSQRQKGHVFADSKEELLTAYKNHQHGIIQSISEPFLYNDGTDDVYYMANVKLNNSKAAAALMEHGANTWTPFAVSPHIWHIAGPENDIVDWEGISLSLVPQGAYGTDAVVTKYCKGESDACTKSMAASQLCSKEDENLAASITSTITYNQSNPILAQVIEHPQVKEVQNSPQPIQEEKKDESVSLTKEQHESLLKEKEEKEQLKQQLAQLVNENKTTKLNNIFKSVKDESLKKTLTEKYFNADVNILNDFYGDVSAHVFPSLVEEAKAQAEQELKTKTIEENKSKSKAAGSLPKEPKVEDDKAASVVPNNVNEILRMKRMLEVGF